MFYVKRYVDSGIIALFFLILKEKNACIKSYTHGLLKDKYLSNNALI